MGIHDRKLALDVLTQPDAKLHIILDSLSDAYLLLDRSLAVVVINRFARELARQLLGREVLEGAALLEYIPVSKQPEYARHLQDALAGKTTRIEKSASNSQGGLEWYELHIHPALQDDRQIAGVVIQARSITERKASEEVYLSLYQAEKEQRIVAEALREAGTILSKTLDYGMILDGLLEQVANVVQYDRARILLREDQTLRVAREHPKTPQVTPGASQASSESSAFEYISEVNWIIKNNKPLVYKPARAKPGQSTASGTVNSSIGVPIQSQDQVIAVIWLDKYSPDYYQQEHIRMLSAFAGQAALALQNAQLFDSIQRRAREAETLRQAAAAVTSELGLNQVLDRILINLRKVVQYDRITLYLLDADQLQMVARSGFNNDNLAVDSVYPSSNELFQEAIKTGRPLVVKDAMQDSRLSDWATSQGIRGWLGVPLHLRGRIIGFMALHSRQVNAFTDAEATLAQAFANEATIALENARLFKELQSLATYDQLTGIFNRHHFFHLAKLEYQRARRQRKPLSAILFDLDTFKTINDTYSHAVGDQVLHGVATVCKENLRQVDILGRYGGEEFMVLLPNTSVGGAQNVAERLCEVIAATDFETDRGPVHVSASFGIAEIDDRTHDIDTLLKNADRAAYISKLRGKNRVAVLDDSNET